jgi:hypothetical protein
MKAFKPKRWTIEHISCYTECKFPYEIQYLQLWKFVDFEIKGGQRVTIRNFII